ncbi:FMN-dependent NADH-azoreductase [Companilactobacillus zhongbaensis]|uniref:FMN-dependent NADH-azoreductase n=1 Tax=Companilactobacillus zhongbaensis TaxID=2486009 RepID=UPI000F7A958A|nr:NAD(P)H-dependent oxidoreductase [Companilactobacillus zhongbaensis]
MKTLIINTHPDFSNENHFSKRMEGMFLKLYYDQFPGQDVDILNLYDEEIPQITNEQLLGIWNKQVAGITLSAEEQRVFELNQKLLAQFKEHHRIVIVAPVHNFNVTSKMKDYIDNVLVARQTFRYTAEGSVGLMTDDYRVMLLQASGSVYTNDDRYTPLEFQRTYLQAMFKEMMGFDEFSIVRLEGTQTSGVDVEEATEAARRDLEVEFGKFYK